MTILQVNGDRVIQGLADLGKIGATPNGGVNRPSFSKPDGEARSWMAARARQAGLEIASDGIGNIFIDLPINAQLAGEPAVWSGSHIDSVPGGGRFDGCLGVLAAIESLRRMQEEKLKLVRPVRVVVYADEEGSYSPLLGSTALTKGFTREQLEGMVGRDGEKLRDVLVAAGGDLDQATNLTVDPESLHASVELHVEQGPKLEAAGNAVGIVSAIVGLGGGKAHFEGRADHAGTTPMDGRKDALLAAAEFVRILPALVSGNAVVTCGRIDTEPGSSNVVSSRASVSIDFRDSDERSLRQIDERIRAKAAEIAEAFGLTCHVDFDDLVLPVALDSGIQKTIEASAVRQGFSTMALISGAIHDSLNLSTITPTGMIFVPSVGGRSHCHDELTMPESVIQGSNILLDVLVELASN